MKKLCAMISVACVVALLSGNAFGLDIQLSPQTLVLSSGGDQLTIHTDVKRGVVEEVTLDVGNQPDVAIVTWSDACGNLVVRCSKNVVSDAAGDFDGRFTNVDVTLTIITLRGDEEWASENLRVRK